MTVPPFRTIKTYTPQPLGKAGAMSHVFQRNTNPAEFHRHVLQAQNAFSFCKFQQSIDHYNTAIQELNVSLATTVLLQRATIHEIAGSYSDAFKDAKSVIAIDSTLPDGYLSACNTLLLENKYREALLLSREGCAEADCHHPQYEALVQLQKSISREVHIQNTWLLNKLPFDVIENVLTMLPLLTRIQLSLTCMDWNEFLDEWTGMWHDIRISHRVSCHLSRFLDCVVNSQVRTLIIDVEMLDKLQLICSHAATYWNKLESLELHYFTQRHLVFPVIEASGTTLQHIRFKDTRGIKWAAEPIQYILKTCPNLKSLQCARDEYAAICPRMITQPLYFDTPLKLTSLRITRTTMADYLDKLLPYCPDLQDIVLDAHDHDKPQRVEILDHVYEHCPKLVSLFYSGSGCFSYKKQGVRDYFDEHFDTDGQHGLRSLVYIAGTTNESYQADKQIIRFLERSEDTLKKLHVTLGCQTGAHRLLFNYSPCGLEVIQHASKLSFPVLQQLTVYEPPNRFIQPFNYQHGRQRQVQNARSPSIPPTRALAYLASEDMCSLLAGSPSLTKVCIRSDTLITDIVLEKLATLKQLRHVSLGYATECMRESIYYPSGHVNVYPMPSYLLLDTHYRTVNPSEPSFSTQGMMSFMQSCSNLEEMILSNLFGRLDDDLLEALTHCKGNVWRLVLGAPHEFTTRALIQFGRQMQDSVLTHLTILGMDHELHRRRARIGNIMALTGLKHLVQLRLSLINSSTAFKSCKPILARFILASYNTSRLTVIFQTNTSIDMAGEYKRMTLAQQECHQGRHDDDMDEDMDESLSPPLQFHIEHVGRWMTTYELYTLNANLLHEQDI